MLARKLGREFQESRIEGIGVGIRSGGEGKEDREIAREMDITKEKQTKGQEKKKREKRKKEED